jgi:hypothetical protein
VNATIARYGGRMTLDPLDTPAVERWVEHKQAQARAPQSEKGGAGACRGLGQAPPPAVFA